LADVAFILAFSIIKLNTDVSDPAITENRRTTKEGFVRNSGQDLLEQLLTYIFDTAHLYFYGIKESPISLKEDDEAREREPPTRQRAPHTLVFRLL
jgi:Sec7-like guanine-nucleotide exchange factor